MTEFKLDPIKLVIIRELIHESLDNFIHTSVATGGTVRYWIDGIIIDTDISRADEEPFKKSILGTEYYDRVVFVKYPEYTKKIRWDGGNYEIALVDCTNYVTMRELAKWIKSQPVWKSDPK